MVAPRYPGDPRARPDRGFCAVTATGDIKRRRDDLVHRAAVCWLRSNSHDTEPHHLGEALRSRLQLRHEDLQVLKHYPEQFLVIFREPADRDRLLERGAIYDGGRDFSFAPWNERLNAVNVSWEFRVKVRIEGIPPHCWAEDVAASALGRSCTVHYAEEKTRRRERTRTFDLWAWCSNPCDIPKEVILTVTSPDREPPPTSIPFLQAPRHRDDPVDIKRGQVYTLRNHLEWVEDLTFLQGRGRQGGLANRKASREFIWTYGVPDSVGERPPGRGNEDRGREMGRYHRRDDDGHDHDHDRRSHGTRRHRSLSGWARNSRCRGAMDDCVSSNRWRGGRASPPHRNRQVRPTRQKWRIKENNSKENRAKKRVTFADPIATELRAPKPILRDDSILLIKDKVGSAKVAPTEEMVISSNVTNEELMNWESGKVAPTEDMTIPNSTTPLAVSLGEEGDQQLLPDATTNKFEPLLVDEMKHAMTKTLKLMGVELTATDNSMHFQRPVELSKMAAIQVLIEQENKKKMVTASRRRAARVALEA